MMGVITLGDSAMSVNGFASVAARRHPMLRFFAPKPEPDSARRVRPKYGDETRSRSRHSVGSGPHGPNPVNIRPHSAEIGPKFGRQRPNLVDVESSLAEVGTQLGEFVPDLVGSGPNLVGPHVEISHILHDSSRARWLTIHSKWGGSGDMVGGRPHKGACPAESCEENGARSTDAAHIRAL